MPSPSRRPIVGTGGAPAHHALLRTVETLKGHTEIDLQVLFGAFYEALFFLVRRWTGLVDEEIDSCPSTSGVGWTPGTRALAEQAAARNQPTVSATRGST